MNYEKATHTFHNPTATTGTRQCYGYDLKTQYF